MDQVGQQDGIQGEFCEAVLSPGNQTEVHYSREQQSQRTGGADH
jgi:hypothetical protein